MKAAPLFEYDAREEPVSDYRHYLSWLLTKIWSAKQNKTKAWEVLPCFFEDPMASHCPHAGANSLQVGIEKMWQAKLHLPQPQGIIQQICMKRL